MVAAPAPPADCFDVAPFWAELETMLRFIRDRLKFGQTDVEGTKMDEHITTSYQTLRQQVIKDAAQARVPCRLWFWDDCKKALEPIFDSSAKVPKGSVSFEEFYRSLAALQSLVFNKPDNFWMSLEKPRKPPFSEVPPTRARSRSRSARPANAKGKGKGRGKRAEKRAEPKKDLDPRMGRQGIWLWRNPPRPLYEGPGFWIFYKQAYWVCETPKDKKEFDKFQPSEKVQGNLTMWIREKYAKQYPFLDVYDLRQRMNYGLLNRLDRETSGPVVVVKDERSFWKLKQMRDTHNWHKEYLCLVHGRIPVDRWQGVLEEWLLISELGTSAVVKVVDRWTPCGPGEQCRTATSLYQVQDYFTRKDLGPGRPRHFTLVKVRIVTGLRHQIRVHMSNLMKKLGSKIGEGEDYGLVSDFLYLSQPVSEEDQEKVCERVFLHERMLGLWDPEDKSQTVCAKAPLPQELETALSRLSRDEEAVAKLNKYKRVKAREDPIEAFCQKYKIGPGVWNDLHGDFWKERPEKLRELLQTFEDKAGDGLPTLSMDGDHSFLFEGIIEAVKRAKARPSAIQDALWNHIECRLWEQQLKQREKEAHESAGSEPLPPGWRRMQSGGEVFYLHESGFRDRRQPVPDVTLRAGWVKLACLSRPGEFIYFHMEDRRTLLEPPTARDCLPTGWKAVQSRKDPNHYFYVHTATGITQTGMPCEGPVEDLPDDWEKVASSREGGQPYYFNRATGETQLDRPEKLPPGWKRVVSTHGKVFYYNEELKKSSFDKPREALPELDGSVTPVTPSMDDEEMSS